MTRLIIFGTGKHLQDRIGYLLSNAEILAFSDNNSSLWGHDYFGKKMIAPFEILNQDFDRVVVATNKYYREINRQLLELGVRPEQICTLDIFLAKRSRGHISFYGTVDAADSADALLISPDLNYNGGTLACVYAALALRKDYGHICLAAPSGNMKLIQEISDQGIAVAIAPALLAPGPAELALAANAKFVLANVYLSIAAACEFSRVKPVLWWIHENSSWINQVNDYYHCNDIKPDFHNIHTVAVCRNVRANLKKAWPDLPVSIMNYGLPDFFNSTIPLEKVKRPIVFAVVGGVMHRKAQDIFVKAAAKYNETCCVPAEFWMIGEGKKSECFTEVMNIAKKETNIFWKGEMTREELEDIYPQIDVIVCPSRQEGLPIVVNEGLMNAKVCIVADTAGDNDYIVNGESGFFFHGEDIDELTDNMVYAAENYENLGIMRQKARQVFVDHYSMESFSSRLEQEIARTIEKWQQEKPLGKHSIFCCTD
jgi:glycosyltransferase involved in cell wall biosynthesis